MVWLQLKFLLYLYDQKVVVHLVLIVTKIFFAKIMDYVIIILFLDSCHSI